MKEALLSFALVVLVEAIGAVVEYLRRKLMSHIHRGSQSYYGDPDMA